MSGMMRNTLPGKNFGTRLKFNNEKPGLGIIFIKQFMNVLYFFYLGGFGNEFTWFRHWFHRL